MANPKGSKPDKLIRDALVLELKREAKGADGQKTQKLNLLARKLVDRAIEDGEVSAFKEIHDRVDGKSIQPHAGDDGGPIELVHRIAREIVHPDNKDG